MLGLGRRLKTGFDISYVGRWVPWYHSSLTVSVELPQLIDQNMVETERVHFRAKYTRIVVLFFLYQQEHN